MLTGWTGSTDFPTTIGAYDTSYNGSFYDVFVSKLDSNLSASTVTPTPTPTGTATATVTPTPTPTPTISGQTDACITWDLLSSNAVTSAVGNITGLPESIGVGSSTLSTGLPANLMSIYGYSNGQQLWVGNTGGTWVPDPPSPNTPLLDPLRYIQFDASPITGNSFTVTNVSFNYGDFPLNTNFNILNFKAYYSTDNWANSTVLNSTALVYLNTAMSPFNQTISVPVPSGQTFSLRIYPYPVLHGIAMTPTFAIHNNVVICGTTTSTVTPTPTPTQGCVQPPSDMVGWWPLDETQGPTAYDFAGSFNNDGAWMNSPGTVTGKVAGALRFNGSNYVEVGPAQTEINFQTNEDFSIDVWVQTVGSQSTRTLVDKRTENPQGNVRRGYHLYLYNGKPGLQLADGSYTDYNSTASTAFVADGNWHHIAVTVDRNNTSGLNIYVDGSSTATLDPTGHVGNLTNGAPLVFGGKNQITPSFTFVGILDELELFNRALTQTEIQDIYNAGSAGKCKPTPTPTPQGKGKVIGFVEDVDEEPLEGVTVGIKGELSDSTETDEDGYYEFGGLPKGDYTITYKKKGYRTQTQDVSLNEGEEKELDTVTMEQIETGEIFGNVADIKGNPLESVSLDLKGKKTKVKQTASTDADGDFEFTDLEADTYVITATIKGYKSAKQTITLKKGEDREIEFKLKKKGK